MVRPVQLPVVLSAVMKKKKNEPCHPHPSPGRCQRVYPERSGYGTGGLRSSQKGRCLYQTVVNGPNQTPGHPADHHHPRSLGSYRVDIGFVADELSLDEYGIAGRIVYTPGHTAGSISVLLDSGEAVVGDMAMNSLPMRLSPGLPVFAENLSQLMESWRMILKQGVATIYPSHGGPFPADVMHKAVS